MEREPLVDRHEIVNALFAVHDLNENVLRIREILEEEFGEEEDMEEDER